MEGKKLFTILIPVYYNELNIPHTVPRLQNLQSLLPDYELEFVFVDDGSGDNSLQLLLEAKKEDSRIKIIKLSKNCGSMAAIQAGLHHV
ncbi:glycosyltransferase, partial [Enterobacter quasiroggenkampii]|nr:glycosyltransferase [Enterobacter quasiroggenkampii]